VRWSVDAAVRIVLIPPSTTPDAAVAVDRAALPVIDLIATGKLRALAVTAPTSIAALRDVPTVIEAGLPDLVTADWIGFAAKRGTAAQIRSGLNKAINKVLVEPKIHASFDKIRSRSRGWNRCRIW